ncbi:hypothetical protein BJ165DRAFT_1529609 [Panaeolus papilionaceus]|nr:hypothetical protein BJ165DRAFT_1529609 [Panaeolus papilionaceus]
MSQTLPASTDPLSVNSDGLSHSLDEKPDIVDLHDLLVILNFVRAQQDKFLVGTSLVEVTSTIFQTTELEPKAKRLWDSAEPVDRVGMVFDVPSRRRDNQIHGPKYFLPSNIVRQPPSPFHPAYTPRQLETIYFQALNSGSSIHTTSLIECLFETWPKPWPLVRIRVPPSRDQAKVEYITSPYVARRAIEFTVTNPRQFSATVTPYGTIVNGFRDKPTYYSVIGFSRIGDVSASSVDLCPIDTIVDLSSMEHGDVGRAYNYPFIVTSIERYLQDFLPNFAQSNTFSQATYSLLARQVRGAWGEHIREIVMWVRRYYKMKIQEGVKSPYCAYCGMPEIFMGSFRSPEAPFMRCSTCKDEYYCSQQHQQFAWSYHKHFCQPHA